jgi:hypothetical protein
MPCPLSRCTKFPELFAGMMGAWQDCSVRGNLKEVGELRELIWNPNGGARRRDHSATGGVALHIMWRTSVLLIWRIKCENVWGRHSPARIGRSRRPPEAFGGAPEAIVCQIIRTKVGQLIRLTTHIAYAGNFDLPFMLVPYRQQRSLLFQCLDILPLHSSSQDRSVLIALAWLSRGT